MNLLQCHIVHTALGRRGVAKITKNRCIFSLIHFTAPPLKKFGNPHQAWRMTRSCKALPTKIRTQTSNWQVNQQTRVLSDKMGTPGSSNKRRLSLVRQVYMYFPGTMLLAAGTIMGWMASNGCTSDAGLGTTNGRFPVAMTGGAKYTGGLPKEKILQVLPWSVQSKISMFHSRRNLC